MPYIKPELREVLEPHTLPKTVGELNYVLTRVLMQYAKSQGFRNSPELNYATINDMIGALECCKLELYRRRAADYEDQKMFENGDVYHINS